MLKTPLPKKDFKKVKLLITNLNENYAAINKKPTNLNQQKVHHENGRKQQKKFTSRQIIQTVYNQSSYPETDQKQSSSIMMYADIMLIILIAIGHLAHLLY